MKSNLEDMKEAYQLSHNKEFIESYFGAELQIQQRLDYIWKLLSKEEKTEYKKWKEFEKRIRNNDFPELSK